MFQNIDDLNLNLKIFLNKYIDIPNVGKLYCLTNNEISEIGFNNYSQYLSILCIEKENIPMFIPEEYKNEEVSTFECLVISCLIDLQFKELILTSLSIFFKEKATFFKDMECFYIGDISENKFITIENYEYIKFVLKKQNGIKVEEPEKFANSLAQQMAEKMKKMREKYSKCSNGNNEQICDYSDIISSVCAKHNSINPFNIGDLTINQTIDQFKRLNMIDKYQIDVQSLLHGAKKEDVGLEGWFTKIKIN